MEPVYPKIKELGYYSESATNQDVLQRNILIGTQQVQNLKWVVKTDKHTPNANTFKDEKINFNDQTRSDKHGPTTKDLTVYDFPEQAFKPKVQMPYYTKPGNLPRKVQIERLKRHYQDHDIKKLLDDLGVPTSDLMPKHQAPNSRVRLNTDRNNPAPFHPYLDLYLFDDSDFDCRTPEDWLDQGNEDGMRKPIPAIALLPSDNTKKDSDPRDPSIEYTWVKVGVLDYDPKKILYFVHKTNAKHRVIDKSSKPVIDGGFDKNGERMNLPYQYWIPRIQVMFFAEDPKTFANRVAAAYFLRRKVEAELRYNLYIDCMPTEGIDPPSSSALKRTTELARTVKSLSKGGKELAMVSAALEKEASLDYMRTMNKLLLHDVIMKNKRDFAFVYIPSAPVIKVPEKACVSDFPAYDMHDSRGKFAFVSLLTKREAIDAIVQMRHECNKVADMALFHVHIFKPMKIDEFEQAQSQVTSATSLYLRDSWLTALRTSVKKSFFDAGKGWFNMRETNWEVYNMSKLKKLMEMAKFMMQDSIRYLVQFSLAAFTQMVIDASKDVRNMPTDYVWPHEDFVTSHIRPKKIALFYVDLIIDTQGVRFSTELGKFSDLLVEIFDRGINSVHSVPQLEKYILEDMFWAGTPLLEAVGLHEPPVEEFRNGIRRLMANAQIPIVAYADKYKQYLEITNLDINTFIKKYEALDKPALDVKVDIEKYLEMKDTVERILPQSIVIGTFFLSTDNVRKNLSKKCKDMAQALLDMLARVLRQKAEDVCDEYKKINRKIYEKPTCIEEMDETRNWMKTVPELIKELQETAERTNVEYDVLDDFWYSLSQDDSNARFNMIAWPFKIDQAVNQVTLSQIDEEDRFQKLQLQDTANFNDRLDSLQMSTAGFAAYSEMHRVHEYANEARRVYKQLKDAQELAAKYNNRERLFGWSTTNYDRLSQMVKEFEPFRSLWVTVSDWLKWHDSWMNDPLTSINAEDLEKNVTDSYRTMHKSVKYFAENSTIQDIAQTIKDQIEKFRPNIPLIQALRNPGMRARHWEALSDDLGFPIVPKADLTFKKCLEKKLGDHIEAISKVADIAGKEYSIEVALNKMEDEWREVRFEVMPYKETGTYIIKIAEEVTQQVDDHTMMTQSMTFSPYKKPFEDRINQWESKLKTTADVLDEWIQCQRSWLYLEPIFSSEDITRQLPVESKRFQTMDRMWRKIMKNCKENPQIITLCPDSRLLEQLRECNRLLDQVQKGLTDYLETKRMSFPRFFFLSDDELLEILSQTKDPTRVQPHLRKCFENMAKLRFEDDLQITRMYSSENEEVIFRTDSLYPKGNVEDWMSEIERVMQESLRLIMKDALEDYKTSSRNDWVLAWPGQLVIAGSQTYWTSEVSDALDRNDLDSYFQVQLGQLEDLRNQVKMPLSPAGRQILSALIVVEVHARDVVLKMIDEGVKNVNDFEWISQLRYYWTNENLSIRAVNAEFPYGWEYLGNTGRLVITPLTDRCYLTLTGALHLKFGGAPAGPAGTGKTETTKDLAKAMAIQCVVFNCSDQLDFMAMGKFFKGLASSGAWACFDEFNRIDIEVLSVVAMQITTIHKAQEQRVDRFLFEGSEIALRASCAVFITMNPGYAGRTELPDNLKALFRPVAMMVPDYALIAEISLFSFGFSEAKALSKKIVATFKLSSEQLSSQDHYDFGMRAVKSVISAAGNLKRQNPEMEEELIALRAIRDVNVPKFLTDDLKLFNGIVSDLFPNVEDKPIDYGNLLTSLNKMCKKNNLKDVHGFIHKCIQLYETTVVRHGLMLVGPTGSGKTKCYEMLQKAMTSLAGEVAPSGDLFKFVHSSVLNPKSITMGQLYGEFDALTHEWTDGILSSLIRIGTHAENDDKRWYVFDGPVDAVWIENMNSVLDDNKKLCLSSGEIIQLSPHQTLMFEVQDLAVASPATVSRCGMVYLEPSILGLQPFVECWLYALPDPFFQFKDQFESLFNKYLEEAVDFIRRNCREIVPSMDSNLTFSLLKLLECFFRPFLTREDVVRIHCITKETVRTAFPNIERLGIMSKDAVRTIEAEKPLPVERNERLPEVIDSWFIFSLIWSVGATCDETGRAKFSTWLREKMAKEDATLMFPNEGLVYDYWIFDGGITAPDVPDDDDENPKEKDVTIAWKSWMEGVEEYKITSDMKFADIMVPTLDTVRSSKILELLLHNNKPLCCVGPTGTSKTLTISRKLISGMPKEFVPEFMVFSAKTSANQTQDLIDGKLDKRRKGVFGPPLGKLFIFFIDDLNMPALETFGAQPPIELIRQWCDFKGWYDRKSIGDFRNIVDVNFACSMGPPGGGRNPITPRLLRHFNYLSFNELSDSSKSRIFGIIAQSWLSQSLDLVGYCDQLVATTITVYNTITEQLLPTPSKSHYTFNLRDLSKVFQGMLMFNPALLSSKIELLRLWWHENCRVFQDRLVNDDDRKWFENLLDVRSQQDFTTSVSEIVTTEPLIYADIMHQGSIESKVYEEIVDFDKMNRVIAEGLEEYNNINPAHLNLVMFVDAIRHLCRIGRILRQPQGNALLLGIGGSGRQSLTKLASHMTEFDCFQIELSKTYGLTDWRNDLKKVMLKAGLESAPIVFLFADTQIKDETFLEDLNNVLNAGDVPNIYSLDELDKIYTSMKPVVQEAGLQPTKTNLFSSYTKRVRANLHTVVTMSPIGEIFRARLRQFPALVNCCTIDWFSEWPQEALLAVANDFLSENEQLDLTEELKDSVVKMCEHMHTVASKITLRFKAEMNRSSYVTPTSYLQLLKLVSTLLIDKKEELSSSRDRTKAGLEKLLSTQVEVEKLQGELETMRPMLEEAVKDANSAMVDIERDTAVAEETKAMVGREEKEASVKMAECKAIADDAQKDLDEAMPLLDEAVRSLKTLNRNDIVEVRALQRPPEGVKVVIEAICIMRMVKPRKVAGDKPGARVDDYWEVGKSLLQDPQKFLQSLYDYDKDNIPESVISQIQPYIDNENFQPAAIARVSKACTSICQWVRAMYKYHFINKAVEPKRQALHQAQEELREKQHQLEEAKSRLRTVEEGLATLQARYNDNVSKKQDLEARCKECEQRLIRADKLIGGLADEKDRWQETVARLTNLIDNIIGDILISAGMVAYSGPFTGSYRHDMMEDWKVELDVLKIPHTSEMGLIPTLGDQVKIRNWQVVGLPKDTLSVENGIIVQYSRRWPLFIDPQGQANKWIKNLEREKSIDVIKLSDKDYIRTLENAIRFGKPCMLENVGEELDPALDPILQKQTFKQSGSTVIKLGDAVIPYHDDFKLYITTKLPNPYYTPEMCSKCTLLNFTLSPSGLEDQLLGLVVAEERPDLEDAKNQLIVSNARMKTELKEIEDKILYRLSSSEGSPVDDLDLIQVLEASKTKSHEIKSKVAVAEQTERDIDKTRSQYIPVANNSQILFFCVADLSAIDPMYQYSLEWFIGIFISSIQHAEKSDTMENRIKNVNNHFTFNLYSNICRSLFEKHKLLFSFLLSTRILMSQGKINMAEWQFLLAGGAQRGKELPNPAPEWLSERAWNDILCLSKMETFHSFPDEFDSLADGFKKIFDSAEPHREEMPGDWNNKLDSFQRMIIIKCLRTDKVTNAMQDFVSDHLGQRFIEPQTAELMTVFKDSSPSLPLIFVLSQGTDPAADLYKFAEEMKFSRKLAAISLGQGQGPIAESMVRQAMERGKWVFFQNCHLSPSWMPSLERLVEQIDPEKVHRDFRLWLTSMPSPKFPVYILQNGCKMTVEPPRGIKANLMKSYAGMNDDFLNSCREKTDPFKHLLLSLSFFHACALERRKFGALGFNIAYEFTDGDLRICISQLKMFLLEYEEIPFKVLKYTAGHINYGGRVTDDWDRRCLMNILEGFYNPIVLDENYSYSPSGMYHQLSPNTDYRGYMEYIKTLPINDSPEIFGLHDNANITYAQNETYTLLGNLLKLQPRTTSGGGVSREEVMAERAKDIIERISKPIPLEPVLQKYPVMYEQSMNTVLTQEIIRYNRLLAVIHSSLPALLNALKGLVVMSQELEDLGNSLFNNAIPKLWAGKAYPSLKPLAAWVEDLGLRMNFMKEWIANGIPPVFWMSGFFFPQAFLTGTLQNYARKKVVSIDTISFNFEVLKQDRKTINSSPEDGCYIYGFFIEGGRWDSDAHQLAESKPKELYTEVPAIWLIPVANRKPPTSGIYDCPVYKTLTRAGTLSTTGHSTNFVFSVELPSDMPQNHWIKRAVAMLCALNY